MPSKNQGVITEVLIGVAPTTDGGSDGKITGTTTSMEYKLSTKNVWKKATGDKITGLSNGTYNVRYAAKPGYNAGAIKNVTVGAYEKSDVSTLSALNPGAGILSPEFAAETQDYTVELDAGTTGASNVTATAKAGAKATVEIAQAEDVTAKDGIANKATVKVKAEDGTEKTYTITFSVALAPLTSPSVNAAEGKEEVGRAVIVTFNRDVVEADGVKIKVGDTGVEESVATTTDNAYTTIAKLVEGPNEVFVKIGDGEYIKIDTITVLVSGKVGSVTNPVPYAEAKEATKAQFKFEVTKELGTGDSLRIGEETFTDVTDAASIITKINAADGGSATYTASAVGKVITLTQKTAASGVTPEVTVANESSPVGKVGSVTNPVPYAESKEATKAQFKFEVTKVLLETDKLKIGEETFTDVTDAASIIAKINAADGGSATYTASAEGEVITLVQKTAASGAAPTVEVNPIP